MSPNELRPAEPGRSRAASGARVVLGAPAIGRALTRIAHEILEKNPDARIVLAAIAEGGIPVGEQLAERLVELGSGAVSLGVLDVTLYRDDVIVQRKRPLPRKTKMPESVTGKRVILVEDVVSTGRTVRAAMDAVIDFGRPEAIQVATLVDRGHREFPIRVDYVGKNLPTALSERVVLRGRKSDELEVVVE
jgi:pyrimidine operon attenuation protein/uracil phosphoribosyltransferase